MFQLMLENCTNSTANEQNNIMIVSQCALFSKASHLATRLFRSLFLCIHLVSLMCRFVLYFFAHSRFRFFLSHTSMCTLRLIYYSFGATDPLRPNRFFPRTFKIEQIYKFFSFFFAVSFDFCFYWICLSEKLFNTIMLSPSLNTNCIRNFFLVKQRQKNSKLLL